MEQGRYSRNTYSRALSLASLVLLVILPLLNTVVTVTPTYAATAHMASTTGTSQLLVQFTTTASATDIAAAVSSVNGTDVKTLSDIQTHEVNVASGTEASAIATLQANPAVVNASQEVTMQTASIPNDPGYSNQWALPKISWDGAYGTITPAGHATIAVLDTGVDAAHPDLSGVVDTSNSISEVGGNPTADPNGHGTEMAGIAAASVNNNVGMAGVDYAGASVSSVQVLGANGTGTDANVTAGVLWAADHGANVILMSIYTTGYSSALAKAISYAQGKGVLVVASTGNSASNVPTYPAGDPGVLGVTATDQNDALLSSDDLVSADVAAPGASIYATQPGNEQNGGNYGYVSGTSPAAAEAAGLAGLLIAKGDNATQAYNQITGATDPISGQSFGRINVLKALGGPPVTVTPQPTPSTTPQPVPSPTYVVADQCNANGSGSTGQGTMTVNPTSATAGSGGNSFTFTFNTQGDSGHEFCPGSKVIVQIPTGWTTAAGHTSITASGCTKPATGTGDITANAASVTVNLDNNTDKNPGCTFTLSYTGVSVPSSAGTYTFTTQSQQNGGAPENIASSPSVTVTGSQVSVQLSVSTAPGGTAMTSSNNVTAHYTSGGAAKTATLWDNSNTPSVSVDTGTTVTFDAASSGSSNSERWQANSAGTQPSCAVSSTTTNCSATYYDQLANVVFGASVATGGTALSPGNSVTASYKVFGIATNATPLYATSGTGSVTAAWADKGVAATFSAASSASSSTERWQANSGGTQPSVTVSSTSVSATYYDQLNVTFSASTVSGGTAMTSSNYVTASYYRFGVLLANTAAIYDGHSLTDWADRTTTATAGLSPVSSGSGTTERWQATSSGTAPSFTISASQTYSATYYDQIANVVFGASVASGGNALSSTNSVTAAYKVFGVNTNATPLYATSGTGSVTAPWADKGVVASFSANSSSPPANERWQANSGDTQPSVAVSSTSVSATYYDQLNPTFHVVVASGGDSLTSGNAATATYTSFGVTGQTGSVYTGTDLTSAWADRGSTATLSANSSNPPAGERWQINAADTGASFTVGTSTSPYSATYYDQLTLTVVSTCSSKTLCGSPGSTGTAFGSGATNAGITAFYYDRGSTANATLGSATDTDGTNSYSFTGWSGAASGTNLTSSNITMSSAQTATANWTAGKTVTLSVTTASGGTAMASGNSITATYTTGGQQKTVQLWDGHTASPVIDSGTTVTFSAKSSGSTVSERWQANSGATQPTCNVVSTTTTCSATYYDQLNVTFQASTATGGTTMTSSNHAAASYTQFGSATQTTGSVYDGTNLTDWADRASTATLSATSSGSSSTERWQANSAGTAPSFTVGTSSSPYSATYYDQLKVTFSASTANGTTLSASNYITASYNQFAGAVTSTAPAGAIYDSHPFSDWADRASSASLGTQSSASNGTERWRASSTPSIIVGSVTAVSGTYYDQLNVTFQATTATGGTAMTSSNSVTASYTQFGSGTQTTGSVYDGHSLTDWADRGSTATLSAKSSSSGTSERWQANSGGTAPSFTVGTSTSPFSATYYDQLTLTVTSTCGANTSCGTPGSTGTAFGATVSNGGVSPFYDRGLTANATLAHNTDTSGGTTYTFIGWSGDASGTGTTSSTITMSATRAATSNWATPPAAPTIGTATAGNGQVQLTWTANSNGGSPITSYTVTPYVNGVAQTSLTQTFTASGTCTGTACGGTLTTIQNGTTYTFTVYATNIVGNSPESGQSNAVTPTVGLCAGQATASLALCGFSLTSNFSPLQLTGRNISGNFASLSTFSVQDQQSTGTGWNVTVQATSLSCTQGVDANCSHTDNLGGGLLSMASPLPVGTGGSSCVSGCSSGTLSLPQYDPSNPRNPFFIDQGAVRIASYAKTSGDASYTFAPGSIDGVSGHNLGLTVPANAYAQTYNTTITLTVATGP